MRCLGQLVDDECFPEDALPSADVLEGEIPSVDEAGLVASRRELFARLLRPLRPDGGVPGTGTATWKSAGAARRIAAVGLAGSALAACEAVATDKTDLELHLAKRATFGVVPGLVDEIRSLGAGAWLDAQLSPTSLDLSAVEAKLAQLPALTKSPVELLAGYPGDLMRLAGAQLQLASFLRQVHSPAQLFERMVELWSDHFNVPLLDNTQQMLKVVEDRTTIRPHALGRFKDLLVASAKSPAMLYFLNNAVSSAGAMNENYARELLELHTVGVNGGYVEDDVVAVARLLTGWTINRSSGEFQFRADLHDDGALRVMGWTRPTSGDPQYHGVLFLRWLAARPATATFVAHKIAVRFVADDPDPQLVADLASVYLANDTAIEPVLRALFDHPAFAASATGKFRRPLDVLVAATRALRGQVSPTVDAGLVQLVTAMDGIGQLPFGWPAPNGWPDDASRWLNTGGLIARWNGAGALVTGLVQAVTIDIAQFRGSLAGLTTAQVVDTLAERLLGEELTTIGRDTIVNRWGVAAGAIPSSAQLDVWVPMTLVLLLVTTDFQYR